MTFFPFGKRTPSHLGIARTSSTLYSVWRRFVIRNFFPSGKGTLQIVACPFRDIISVEMKLSSLQTSRRDVICKENIAYLRHALYGLNPIFYRYIIPNGICKENIAYLRHAPYGLNPIFYRYIILNGIIRPFTLFSFATI